ncbi:hypothetical protein IW261DRAFT_1571508 [Armillaria novae-zelandiae]|uniref:Uncharacterized protein n=1 Tax=Armillaria novae-zelandiae TaxID=153914 RepID=A0AA39NUD1_9AGAR|nr:hypothetical protein IW261DRAFT_1571508 [Armillaria novae-zelandiae]
MAPSNFALVDEAIAAVAQFGDLPEAEKTLEGAKRVVAMMDNARTFLDQSSQAMHDDLQLSILKAKERREALKDELAELKRDSVHLVQKGETLSQSPDIVNKQRKTRSRKGGVRVRSSQRNLRKSSERKSQSLKGAAVLGGKDKE